MNRKRTQEDCYIDYRAVFDLKYTLYVNMKKFIQIVT